MNAPSVAFTKQQRLLTSKEFDAVKQTRLTVNSPEFLLLAKPSASGRPRLGLAIAKRCVKLAVRRNIIKRVARESFRHQAVLLPPVDIVLLTRNAVARLDRQELREHLDKLWPQLSKRYTQSFGS